MLDENPKILDLEADKDTILVENNAQTIFDHISELEKDSHNHEKRWFWELLQNAKDAVEDGETVRIQVTLHANKLIFKHSGNPFDRKDILHLIFHGSSKKKAEGKTGRFGTGFMTTHLLSKKVWIKGALIEGGFFHFLLDRNAEDHLEQKEALDQSYERFKTSYSHINPFSDDFQTEFSYELSPKGLELASEGLQLLPAMLPIVLAFNPKIASITTDNFFIAKSGQPKKSGEDSFSLMEQEIETSEQEIIKVIALQKPDYEIALLLAKNNEVWQIKPLTSRYPKLFFDFPLFGTEQFGIPFIINSLKFDPKRERDGIYLSSSTEKKVFQNKHILESAYHDYIQVVDYFGKQLTPGLSALLSFNLPPDYTWLDQTWYKELVSQLILNLTKSHCLFIQEQSFLRILPPAFGHIPTARTREERIDFYQVAQRLFPASTVRIEDLEDWNQILTNYSIILNQPVEEFNFVITKEKICQLLQRSESLENLHTLNPDLGSDLSAVMIWVQTFLSSLSDDDLLQFSSRYKILPNQENEFIRKTADMPKFDGGISEDLKTIAALYGWNLKGDLIHALLPPRGNFESLSQDKVLDELERINRKVGSAPVSNLLVPAMVHHLKWLLKLENEDRLKATYILTNELPSAELTFSARPLWMDESKKMLLPAYCWAENFGIYAEVALEKIILQEQYGPSILSEEYSYLVARNLVYPSPLIIRKKKATKNELTYLLVQKDKLATLYDEKEDLKPYEIEYSDIPYFTTSDENILARTGNSFKRATALLRFLLFQVLPADSLFGKKSALEGLEYTQSLWAARLKGTKWVPFKTITEESSTITSEQPSTNSIGALIEKEDSLLQSLNQEKTAIFFNSLDISVADIMRSLLSDNDKKLQWDLTFSKLLTNKSIDPDLARFMLEDEGLQEVYQKRKLERDLIKRNQDLGYLFEKIFRQIFESPEMREWGLGIERRPFGSDYELVLESDISENGNEILFAIGPVLVELKASGKQVVEMTVLQGETAANRPDAFVLAVLPLKDFEITENNVWKHARFITDIGYKLKTAYSSLQSYAHEKELAVQEWDAVRLNIEEGLVRYQVKSEHWENNQMSFQEFIAWLRNRPVYKD